MKRVIKMSKAWIAALFIGVILTGCGGGSSGGTSASGGAKSADLSWNAPMTRVNNESLSMGELSGYIISYGRDPENLTQTVRINGADTMDYTVTNLDNGTWYFAIQVEDVNGLLSEPSQPVSKTIQG